MLSAALGLAAIALLAGTCSVTGRRPNVIILLSDDTGYGDPFGNPTTQRVQRGGNEDQEDPLELSGS